MTKLLKTSAARVAASEKLAPNTGKGAKAPASASSKRVAQEKALHVVGAAAIAAVDHALSGDGKIATLAKAYGEARKLKIEDKAIDASAQRAVAIATVSKLKGASGNLPDRLVDSITQEAEKLLERGAKRPAELDKALTALRACKSRAMVLLATGKPKPQKRKPRPATVPAVVPPVAPNGKTALLSSEQGPAPKREARALPIVTSKSEVASFLADEVAVLDRALSAYAKHIDGETRDKIKAAIAALRGASK